MERVRTADGQPVVYCLDKIPVKHLPASFTHEEESLLSCLAENRTAELNMQWQTSNRLVITIRFHRYSECDPETALLLLKQMHYDQDDQPVLYSLNYFRADKFSFHVIRKRF